MSKNKNKLSNFSKTIKNLFFNFKHANFLETSQGVNNDIALLVLSSEVTLNEFIQIACLPESNTDSFPTNGLSAYAVGYN